MSFVDESDPNEGLVFRGRIAEDFKLTSGTFVHVAAVRSALLSATAVLSDVVVAGENREFVGAIVWLNAAETRTLGTTLTDTDTQALVSPELREHLGAALRSLDVGKGSATQIARLVIAAEAPSLDAGEMTDKGYINQRAVLKTETTLSRECTANCLTTTSSSPPDNSAGHPWHSSRTRFPTVMSTKTRSQHDSQSTHRDSNTSRSVSGHRPLAGGHGSGLQWRDAKGQRPQRC